MTAKETCRAQHDVFAQGWADGAAGIACETAREVQARFAQFGSVETTLYLNGAEDGARGDRFRLDMSARCGLCASHGNTLHRVKVVIGYAAHARFTAETAEQPIGEIPRQIHTPYAGAPTHYVFDWQGVPVIICETAHRRYEVFRVDGPLLPVEA